MRLLFALVVVLSGATASWAQVSKAPQLFALDRPTADLLRFYYPATQFEVVIPSEETPYGELNRRAMQAKRARLIVYRSDRHSMMSELFKERLSYHGVTGLDLVRHLREREPAKRDQAVARPSGLPHHAISVFPLRESTRTRLSIGDSARDRAFFNRVVER